MRGLAIGLALLATALQSACVQTQASSPPPELIGSHWMRIDDENAAPHVPTLVFGGSGASGFSGCNAWSARIRTTNAGIAFAHVRAQHRCDAAPAMAAESNFFRALVRARAVRLDNDELTLFDRSGGEVARFMRAD